MLLWKREGDTAKASMVSLGVRSDIPKIGDISNGGSGPNHSHHSTTTTTTTTTNNSSSTANSNSTSNSGGGGGGGGGSSVGGGSGGSAPGGVSDGGSSGSSSSSSSSSSRNSSSSGSSSSNSRDNGDRIPAFSPAPSVKAVYPGNGSYSPHSTVNGTPSPPALASPNAALPHALDAARDSQRYVAKVRRFLATLHQFAIDISPEVGERVRHLVLSLLSGAVGVEDFHASLQDLTHFPLRPFVLPFLRSHLPLLHRELHAHARRSNMTLTQYLSLHESTVLESSPSTGSGEAMDIFSSDVSTSGKRKLGHGESNYYENGETETSGGSTPPPNKRCVGVFSPPYHAVGVSPDPSPLRETRPPNPPDDEWKNIHVMLTCILSMVEKTRRALTMLEQRRDDGPAPSRTPTSLSTSIDARGASSSTSNSSGSRSSGDYDADVRKHAAELVAHAIRTTEDRVAEVKRKAEEALAEVKRAAVAEVQRAVSLAEARAQEAVAAERARLEALLREVGASRKDVPLPPQTHGVSADAHLEPPQACWNCGRKAHETCSGCNVARYCGSFCQHKDWDSHHKVCNPTLAKTAKSAKFLKASDSAPGKVE
ncbi:CBFA2/RUNX1 partner transcriptional co-repressor nervy [Oratosquilla oratoria]|uniref:CBFA2/RUNX1 partner transcriptional co-repressor nervy n=1 Tax=Oratosquilla oratoria TaxID=337810 RepID=UPI003F764F73